jgi:serine/threonine protein kinase/tetratricopeptide (TPR) repeat protein
VKVNRAQAALQAAAPTLASTRNLVEANRTNWGKAMTPDRWKRIEEFYHLALARREDQRASYLAEACAGDEELRREVESLLANEEQTGDFLDGQALEAAARRYVSTAVPDLSGKRLGRYEVIARLGTGGMGVVYKAFDRHLDRSVALKVLSPEHFADPDHKRRLVREARAASALNHPNIVTIHDIGSHEGVDFIAMEYVDGRSLARLIPYNGLPVTLAFEYAAAIADALAQAHSAGVIHRDLKPANVMVTKTGHVKLLDFGLARRHFTDARTVTLTREGRIEGTPAYMSPEQACGKHVDSRTDVWAFGCTLYELLVGRRAFCGDTSAETFAKILGHEPDWQALPSGTPPIVRDLLRQCLQKDADHRLRDLAVVRVELGNVLSSRMPARRSTTASRPPSPLSKTVGGLVVLPLANLSGDPKQEYFADGMTDALISGLAKLGALRIISRTSAMRYKGSCKSVPEIAQELKVDRVVEGSVFRDGKRVRITAQLIDAATDTHLWAESYERDLENVLLLQSEVAQAIVREIQVTTTPEETESLVSARQVNPEAYDAYLKGRFHWYRLSERGFNTAEQYFRFAVERDPNCALAFTGIGSVWMLRGDAGFLPLRQVIPKARAAVLRALELDETLAEAHVWLGNLTALYDWDWSLAEKEFQRAIQLNPGSAEAHFYYADLLISMKRSGEAMAEDRRALELDPLNSFLQCFVAWHMVYERRHDEAMGQLRKVLAAEPDFSSAHLGLWGVFHRKGWYEESLAEAKKFFGVLNDGEVLEALDRGCLEAGYHGAMKLAAEKLAARSERAYVPAVRIARLYAHAGERDLALHWLEEAYEHHESPLLHLGVGWDWDCLRDEARFQNLLRRMNLPQ